MGVLGEGQPSPPAVARSFSPARRTATSLSRHDRKNRSSQPQGAVITATTEHHVKLALDSAR